MTNQLTYFIVRVNYNYIFQGFATDKTPITVIGVILKGNDVAKRIKLRHFREDQELPWIAYDRKFSNFFQAPKLLDAPITIDAVIYIIWFLF
jgi:hypothetical protein